MRYRTRLVLLVTGLLASAVIIISALLAWNTRNAVLASAEESGQMVANLLARSAGLASEIPNEVEDMQDAVIAEEMPPLTLKGFGRPLQVYELLGLRESVSPKTIRRKIDGMNITIELARGNREQAIQVLKELIDEIDVEIIAT